MLDADPNRNYKNSVFTLLNKNRETMGLDDAIAAAVKSCIERDILVYFLEVHASEVLNMLTTEWNWDDAKEVWQEEAKDEGIEIGTAIGETKGVEKGRKKRDEEILGLIKQGYTLTDIENMLKAQLGET